MFSKQRGISLIEVLIASAILSFGMMAIVKLQIQALRYQRKSKLLLEEAYAA